MTNEELKRIMAARLGEARLEAGLTQAEAGRRLGSTRQNVRRDELGAHLLGIDRVLPYLRVYGKTILWFVLPIETAMLQEDESEAHLEQENES